MVLAGVPFGCRRTGKPPPASPPAVPAAPAFDESQRARATALGGEIARLINEHRLADLAAMIEFDPLIEAAFAGIDWQGSDQLRGFRQGFVRSIHDKPANMFSPLDGAQARFLRLRDTPTGTTILVRCMMDDGACTYLDFHPRFHPDGKTTLREFFNHATGLSLGETLRSLVIGIVPTLDVSLMDRVFGGKQKIDAAVVVAFCEACKRKDAAAAKAAFPKLPAGVRSNRPIFLAYLQTLMQNVDDPDYLAALDEGRKLYPNDPTLDFLSIDFHLLKKDYAALDASLRRIEERLGKDANLSTLRAVGFTEAGDAAGAAPLVAEALEMEPDFLNAHHVRLKVAILQRDFPLACRVLDDINSRSPDSWEAPDPANGPAFEAFVESGEYRAWLDRRAENAADADKPR